MAKSKLVKANEEIAENVVNAYKKIENCVVEGYKKIENGFVDQFLTKDGESVEDAKKRLAEEQAARDAKVKEATGQYTLHSSRHNPHSEENGGDANEQAERGTGAGE